MLRLPQDEGDSGVSVVPGVELPDGGIFFTLLSSPQVPGVPHLQEHLGRAGLLHHRGNAGHQVQVRPSAVLAALHLVVVVSVHQLQAYVNAPPLPRSTEFVEAKIEEFLASFGERLSGLSEEAFKAQVTALIKLKECEDAHLGEEVDRNWFEVVTQQYVFQRLNKEVSPQ